MQKYGGVSRYFYELIKRLSDKNEIDISLFMGDFINEYGLERDENKYYKFKGKKHTGSLKFKRLLFLLNEIKLRDFAGDIKADIYHPTYYRNFNFVKRNKLIITMHDFTHEKFPGSFRHPGIVPRLRKKQVEKADGIICVSEATKIDLLNYLDVDENKVTVIYHASSLNVNISEPALVCEPYILFVGSRGGYKNFELLFNVYKQNAGLNKDYKLICYGGEEFTKDELLKIQNFGLVDRIIRMVGDDSSLANLYKYASSLVYTSKGEGFGIPVLEAMSFDCPVILSNVSSLPEVGGDAVLYFDPENGEELLEKINSVLFSDSVRQELIEKGKKRCQHFTWEKCANETLNFYQKILNG
jgi:glycosyltransferase involved in cell wall biosynthesis